MNKGIHTSTKGPFEISLDIAMIILSRKCVSVRLFSLFQGSRNQQRIGYMGCKTCRPKKIRNRIIWYFNQHICNPNWWQVFSIFFFLVFVIWFWTQIFWSYLWIARLGIEYKNLWQTLVDMIFPCLKFPSSFLNGKSNWSGKKRGKKVFNWSEVHFFGSTSYEIHILGAT